LVQALLIGATGVVARAAVPWVVVRDGHAVAHATVVHAAIAVVVHAVGAAFGLVELAARADLFAD
jgi:hypothetical protein